MFLDRFTKKYAAGVDVSDTGIKIILLARQGKRITVEGYAQEAFPEGVHCDGRIADPAHCAALFGNAWRALQKVLPRRAIPVVVALADAHTQMTHVTIPTALLAPERIMEEAGKHIPLDPATMLIDWQTVSEKDGNATVFLMSTARTVSEDITAMLEGAQCFPSALESDAVALARFFGKPATEHVIIDLGASRTLFLITQGDLPIFTITLPLTGRLLTEAIAKTLRLSPADAEAAKIRCGFEDAQCTGALREVVREHLDATVQKIRIGMESSETQGKNAPRPIILVGGGAHLKKIEETLTQELSAPVTQGNLWDTVEQPKTFPESSLAWSVAMGLALRGLV